MKKILLATAASFLIVGSAQAAVIVNGSFENAATGFSNPTFGTFDTLNAINTAIDGWTVSNGSVDWINGYWQAADGTHSVDLSGNGEGWIEQTFATTVGTEYTINYFLSGNPDNPDPNDDGGRDAIIMTINGAFVEASSITGIEGASHANMRWKPKFFEFVALTPTTTLRFKSATGNPYGAAIDNISISAVPEPATWALMIGGFGLVGGAMRRRSRIATAIA